MTPEQRAELITYLVCGDSVYTYDRPRFNAIYESCVKDVVAQLSEVKREAYQRGFREAIEKAAKVAESVGPAWEHCGNQIASVVRAMKQEESNDESK